MPPPPPPPPSSPPPSLSSSFASLALSSSTASGIAFPSPAPSDTASLDLGSDDSDDEFIVLQRSQSGTGYDGPLAAGLAAAPDAGSCGGTRPVSDEAGAAVLEPVASSDDERILSSSWASDSIDIFDSDDGGESRPLRWADEGEDELDLPTAPAADPSLSTAGERTPVSGLRPATRSDVVSPPASRRRRWRRRSSEGKKTGSSPPSSSSAASAGASASSSSAHSASAPNSIAFSSSLASQRQATSASSHLRRPSVRNRSSFGSDTPSTFSVSTGSDRSHASRSEGASEEIVFGVLTGSEEDGLSDICTDDSASAVLSLFFDDSNPFGSAGPGGGGALGKLRFWQALIVELGVLPAPDAPWSELSSSGDEDSSDDGAGSSSGASDRTATEAEPFPTSLKATRRLLKAEAHVNLVDYLCLRSKLESARTDDERAKLRSEIKGLSKSSRAALKWYTIRSHKFAKRTLVKNAWLDPLMIDLL